MEACTLLQCKLIANECYSNDNNVMEFSQISQFVLYKLLEQRVQMTGSYEGVFLLY